MTVEPNSNSGAKVYSQITNNRPKYRSNNIYRNYETNLQFLRFPEQTLPNTEISEDKDTNEQVQKLS